MSPIVEQRIIGIEILEFFGSPWHNSRDACVECLLSMLNDIDPRASRAVEAITSSERRTRRLNPNKSSMGTSHLPVTQVGHHWFKSSSMPQTTNRSVKIFGARKARRHPSHLRRPAIVRRMLPGQQHLQRRLKGQPQEKKTNQS